MKGLTLFFVAATLCLGCDAPTREIRIDASALDDQDARSIAILLVKSFPSGGEYPDCDAVMEAGASLPDGEADGWIDALSDALALGHLEKGEYLVAVHARDERCHLLGHGCRAMTVGRGVGDVVHVTLESVPGEPGCDESSACSDGGCVHCGDCCVDSQCSDSEPTTTDVCEGGVCTTEADYDGDGMAAIEDCDDRNETVHGEAPPLAVEPPLDHDCDGQIDHLDGHNAPDCWLSHVSRTQHIDTIAPMGIEVFSNKVFAAVSDGQGGTSLWIGQFFGEDLVRVALLHLDGTAGGRYAQDVAVYGNHAFVLHAAGIMVVDVTDPEVPFCLRAEGEPPPPCESINLMDTRPPWDLTIAPPLLWVSRMNGLDVLDMSQIDPVRGWPEMVRHRVNSNPPEQIVYRTTVRGAMAYSSVRSRHIHCVNRLSPAEVGSGMESCFDAVASQDGPHAGLPARFSDTFVTDDNLLFAVSEQASEGGVDAPPLVWRFDLADNARPEYSASVELAEESLPPSQVVTNLTVAGGTIAVGGASGLHLISRRVFDDAPSHMRLHDFDSALAGPAVREAQIRGTRAVVAAGDHGLYVLRLACEPD